MYRVLFLIALLLPGVALAAMPTAAQILSQAKAASGGVAWDHIHSLRFEDTIEVGGLSGSTSDLNDLLTGRSVSRGTLGSFRFALGFDGKMGWSESPDGEVSPDDSPAAKKASATSAYQTAQAWWYPERWPAKIEVLGTREEDGTTYQMLRITPRGGNPFELRINAKTHLIARFVDRSGMWINGKSGDFVVGAAIHGGPAAQAGLKVGDVITAVNNKPAAAIGLVKFREMLRNEAPGTRLNLTVGSGKAAHSATFVLRRLIPETGGLEKAA